MPQVNYKHEKRQREIEKKKKHDQKIVKKVNKNPAPAKENPEKPADK